VYEPLSLSFDPGNLKIAVNIANVIKSLLIVRRGAEVG